MDPKGLNERGQNYKLNKMSDVYGVGVLMWQISSGNQPFHTEDMDCIKLILAIIEGRRERIIEGTPIEYSHLYQGETDFYLLFTSFFFLKKKRQN